MALMLDDLSDEQLDRRALLAQMGTPDRSNRSTPGLQPPEEQTMRSADMRDSNFNGKDDRDEQTSQQPERKAGTSALMESTYLLGDANQMKKSPKAAFLSNADKYGYNELDQLLADLQANPDYGRFFQGWRVGGTNKDLIQFVGDPSTLAPEWGGVTSFDVIGDFDPTSGTARGWRWGVGEGAPGAAPAASGSAGPPPMMGGGPSSFSGIQALAPTDMDFFNTLQSRLQAILGGPQSMDREALLRMLGA